jgi:hypothetical protein
MTKTRTPNYGIGGMEDRRVAVKLEQKRGIRRREGVPSPLERGHISTYCLPRSNVQKPDMSSENPSKPYTSCYEHLPLDSEFLVRIFLYDSPRGWRAGTVGISIPSI